jgi:hypothetical protein
MLETWANDHGHELITVKVPGQTITHILEWRETLLVLDGGRIGTINQGGDHHGLHS